MGFTRTEFIVITSLTGIFFAGLLIKYSFSSRPAPYRDFDYTSSDSLFLASESQDNDATAASVKSPSDNSRDLGLIPGNSEAGNLADRGRNMILEAESRSISYKKKALPEESSININSAGLEQLLSLPGIGQKTAGKIIELRTRKGRFESVDDLLEVKGIGPSKMNKIRHYIFVK